MYDSKRNQKELSQQVAVVTGGAGVLCAALCKALAESGASVAILDLNEKAAQDLAAEIQSNGGIAYPAAATPR